MDLIDYSNAYADAKAKIYKAQATSTRCCWLLGRRVGGPGVRLLRAGRRRAEHRAARPVQGSRGGRQGDQRGGSRRSWTCGGSWSASTLTYGADVLEILASATDASKVLSFEVPTILEACAKVWNKIVAIADILAEFLIEQATTDAMTWRQLDERLRRAPAERVAEGRGGQQRRDEQPRQLEREVAGATSPARSAGWTRRMSVCAPG